MLNQCWCGHIASLEHPLPGYVITGAEFIFDLISRTLSDMGSCGDVKYL